MVRKFMKSVSQYQIPHNESLEKWIKSSVNSGVNFGVYIYQT